MAEQPKQPTTALAERAPVGVLAIVPKSVDELIRLANILYLGGLGGGASRPESVAAIVVAGLEIGLKPGQALSSIYLQGGRAKMFGDMPLAMVRSSGLLESFSEAIEGHGENRAATCTAKRKGDPTTKVYRFDLSDARKAGLLDRASDKGKGAGAWIAWQDRMLTFRARTPVLRDLFGDVLAGFDLVEDRQSADETTTTATVTVREDKRAGVEFTPPVATTATDAHGELMVDQPTIDKITKLMPVWVAIYGPNPCPTPNDGVRAWKTMLKGTYGVESAKNLTDYQAAELLVKLGECEKNPTAAVFAPTTEPGTASDQQQPEAAPTTAAA